MPYTLQYSLLAAFLAVSGVILGAESFSPQQTRARGSSSTQLFEGRLEQIEFKIFPDGRVEEVVKGVKGEDCHSVTAEINKELGKVYETRPTEELYEEEIILENTNTVSNSISDDSSSSFWEGKSTW